MSEFTEKENRCLALFESAGPYWHAYTSGKETSILFTCDEDMAFVMNVVAQIYYQFAAKIRILAFQIMNNHFHFILTGNENDIRDFFSCVIKRLARIPVSARQIKIQLKQILDIQALRNSIVYVNRNGYVANPSHTPFSYPWGTSRHYFLTFPAERTFSDIKSSEARMIFRGRDPKLPQEWKFSEGYICPSSYCDIKSGMALFRDAHHYFYCISKNVESYSGIATDIDDGDFMTDSELFSEITRILNENYSGCRISSLSDAQKLDLARTLHYKYRSSNGQIRRILGISQYQINQLFHI